MTIPTSEIDRLVELVDEDRLVSSLASMVSIPSVNPFDEPVDAQHREQEFAAAYLEDMRASGLEVFQRDVVPGRPNVFGQLKGSADGPTLMLAGHLDTVGVDGYPDPFNPVIRDNRLYGRGSCDMKAALAAYIEVAKIISDEKIALSGNLVVAGVADEEHMMIGSKEISKNGPIPDFAIIGEPTELQVCHAHKGQLCMHIRTLGKASHSSVPENGVNAINHMGQVLGRLEEYAAELKTRKPHPVCGHARVNPGVIKGGSISSTVPDYCELEVDRRTLIGENYETVSREYRDLLDPLSQSVPDFRFEVGPSTLDNAPLDTPAESEVVQTIAREFETVTGGKPRIGAFPAATDAPNFLCPAVICGPGSLNQAHTVDEYVAIPELVDAARIYLRCALQMIG